MITRRTLIAVGALAPLAACSSTPQQKSNRAQDLVDAATITADRLRRDRPAMNALLAQSQGVMIFPSLIKGGLIWGGQGGSGVLLARDITGGWSAPAFYTLGGISWGLQIGVQDSEVMLVVMTSKGMDAVTKRGVKLGADASVAAASAGATAQAGTTNLYDIYTYADTVGVFAGLSLEGAWVETRDDLNQAYYDRVNLEPSDIVRRRAVDNPGAARLRAALSR
jgi:lipid-binding SYLF domain-containing protein